jgi:hypothetical protein
VPVPNPGSVQPTSRPTTNAEKFSGGEFTGTKKNPWPWGLIVAIILAGVTGMAVAAGLAYYGFCRAAPLEVLKKKTKEEEDSPYTAHGAGGLLDDDGSVYGPSDYQSETNGYSSFYSGSDADTSTDGGSSTMRGDKEKEKKGDKKGEDLSGNNKYTVHSYRGYDEQSDSSSVLTASEVDKGDKKGVAKGSRDGEDQSVESKCTVVSYRGYEEQQDSVGEQSSRQSLREKQLEAKQLLAGQQQPQSFVSSVLNTFQKISPRLFTSPAEPGLVTVIEEEDEDCLADSIYPTHPALAGSGDSFFDNDGVDHDDHGDDNHPRNYALHTTDGYLKSSVYHDQQTIFNSSSGSLDTVDSPSFSTETLSLVEQARARLALARNVPLHHSRPLKVVIADRSHDGSREDDHSTSSRQTHCLVEEARAQMAVIKRRTAEHSNALNSPASQSADSFHDIVATYSSSSLVAEAKARGNAVRGMTSDASVVTGDSVSSAQSATVGSADGSVGSAMGRASASYASYKLKLEQDDRRRTEEAEAVRAALEQTRLQHSEEYLLSEADDHAVRLATTSTAHSRAQDEESIRLDQLTETGGASFAQLGESTDSASSDDASDKLRLREESRLRAEEKARARFAVFKTQF